MRKRIFISHVNNDDEYNRFLPRLRKSLESAGFDVLIDQQRLLPGVSWRNEIYTWLSICHAAVVLLSSRAVSDESIWVPRETALLMWRRALDPRLLVIPVLAPSLDLDSVEASGKFRDLQIRELQAVAIEDAEAAVNRIVSALAGGNLTDRTPFDELADVIAHRFQGLHEPMLEHCSDTILKDTPAPSYFDVPHRLAVKLLSARFAELGPAFDYLMARCPARVREDLSDILTLLGANWVDPEAAQWIARECASAMPQRPSRPIILNAATEFAVRMYLQRASLRPPNMAWPLVVVTGVNGGHGSSRELVDEVEAAFQSRLPLKPDAFNRNMVERRRRQLAECRARGLPVFAALPLPREPREVRRALNEAYPTLNLLFVAGDEPVSQDEYPESEFLYLLPPIEAGAEEEAESLFDSYRAAYSLETIG